MDRALVDPASVFTSPEEVLTRADLGPNLKATILRRWAYDMSELAVAEEEGMRGDENDLQRRAWLALIQVTGGGQQTAPTKQHGIL